MFTLETNRPQERLATSPARPHRMLRTAIPTIELAAGVAGAGVAVALGAHPGLALGVGVGVVVAAGVACTLAAGGTPARLAVGYRVVGLDGGRPPWWGVVLRELARPIVLVASVDSAGLVGAVLGAGTERGVRRATGAMVVGFPRRREAGFVASSGVALAVVSFGVAFAVWGGSLWEDVFLAWAGCASALGAALVALARVEVLHLHRTGELAPTEDVTAQDEQELWTVDSPALPDTGVEVRRRPADGGPGHPDLLVSPRGSVSTVKRRPASDG